MEKVLRQSQACAMLGLSPSSLKREPSLRPIKIGPRAAGYLESEIQSFIESRIAMRDAVWITIEHAAKRIGCEIADVERLIRQGEVQAKYLGSYHLVLSGDVAAFLERNGAA